MKEFKICALGALVSIPISIMGFFMGWAIIHIGGVLALPVLPALMTIELLHDTGVSDGLGWSIALLAQYLGYFLVILVIMKMFTVLKYIRRDNIAQEKARSNAETK